MVFDVSEQGPPKSDPVPVGAPRRSRCMEAAKAKLGRPYGGDEIREDVLEPEERERIGSMTPLERVELAFELGRRLDAKRAAQGC
jgi:hypothetical protein